MRALAPGHRIHNRYQILALAGRGGMGAVYAARDDRLGATVALKQTLAGDEVLRRAFRREARLLAALRHPALPRVLDHFEEAGELFLVMEYVPGEDLGAQLRRRGTPFPAGEVLAWADVLLEALEYLHSHEPPVVHHDIKPQNLKPTPNGTIVLLDFGLARGAAGGQTLMLSGATLAGYTPHYASLEQIQGGSIDVRADIYGLGATLYHLLSGEAPADALARAVARLNGDPEPLTPLCEHRPDIPHSLSDTVMATLALRAADRPATASELRATLYKVAAELTSVETELRTPSLSHARRPRPRLWRWMVGPVLALGLAVGLSATVIARSSATTTSPPSITVPSPVAATSSPSSSTAASPQASSTPVRPTQKPGATHNTLATVEADAPPERLMTATSVPSSPTEASLPPTTAPSPVPKPAPARPRPTPEPTAAPAPVPIIPGP